MAFDKEPVRTASAIPRLTVHLAVFKDAQGVLTYDASADVGVTFTDGSAANRAIPGLEAHLTAAQKTTFKSFLQAMLAKAETEVL